MTTESDARAIDATGAGDAERAASAIVLDPTTPDDLHIVGLLRADSTITFLDRTDRQAATLAGLSPPPAEVLTDEPRRWAYYPWRHTVVGILGPLGYARVRTDRNRNLITADEQGKLSALKVGVVGLSVGHAIAHALAMQGLCGELRLADFDDLELTNLNRVPATVFDIGVNKATAAARRIAEIDPYLDVRVLGSGLTRETIGEFLDGLDVVVEECDSLDMKALVREEARERGQPVIMATSDRGLVDVERFDLEPGRPIFHGLLGELDTATLAGLDNRDKIPHVLRIIDGASLSARAAASLVEVGHTLTTWPQLAGDVLIGASAVAEAVRRIGLGEPLSSGRVRVDMAASLDDLTDPAAQPPPAGLHSAKHHDQTHTEPHDPIHAVVVAASRAPSGGNVQPWHIEATPDAVTIRLAPEHTSRIDVGLRGSAVAVGAAVFNAKVAAAAHHILGPVEITEDEGLRAVIDLTGSGDDHLASLYPALAARETNRHQGTPSELTSAAAEALRAAAHHDGARLELLVDRADIDRAGALLAEADRIRYLTPGLHADMTSELRWPGDESPDSGIDIRSLELGLAELVTLDILRKPDVMALLCDWDAGTALGADTRMRISRSSALAVIVTDDRSLTGYARGGSAAESVWITAQHHGSAVQPISPPFLYAHDDDELDELSPLFAAQLAELQSDFRELTATDPGEAQILILRLTAAPPASVRSRRRPVDNAAPTVF